MINTSTARFDSVNLATEGEQVSSWNVRPFQLVSLLDMFEFRARAFVHMTQQLEMILGVACLSDKEMTEQETQEAHKSLQIIGVLCLETGLGFSADYIGKIISEFNVKPAFAFLAKEIPTVQRLINLELKSHRFFYIPKEVVTYIENDELFGSKVAAQFPEANKEIKEAGNCYATGNNTASVFHLMRAAEHGARAIVKALKIKVWDKTAKIEKDELPYPAELCDWGTLMRVFGEALKKLPTRQSVKASKRVMFYSEAVNHFGLLKDAWRNPLSHTRFAPDEYDEHKAMSVMVNTRHFMQHLAEGGLKEPKLRYK